MSRNATTTATSPKRRLLRRILLIAALLIVAAVVLTLILLVAAPGYWPSDIDGSDPAVARRAEQFERQFAAGATTVREDHERWELELTQKQLNEWLAARLPQWMRNQGIDEAAVRHAEQAMVAIRADRVELATVVQLGAVSPVVRLIYEPRTNDAGRIELTLTGMRAGLVPLPGDALVDNFLSQLGPLDEADQGSVDHARDTLTNIDLVFELGDGRVVSVVGIELAEGTATLVCITADTPVRADGSPEPEDDSG